MHLQQLFRNASPSWCSKVLSSHGIPDDQIVVMMKDDIANNSMNKEPGVIRNRYA